MRPRLTTSRKKVSRQEFHSLFVETIRKSHRMHPKSWRGKGPEGYDADGDQWLMEEGLWRRYVSGVTIRSTLGAWLWMSITVQIKDMRREERQGGLTGAHGAHISTPRTTGRDYEGTWQVEPEWDPPLGSEAEDGEALDLPDYSRYREPERLEPDKWILDPKARALREENRRRATGAIGPIGCRSPASPYKAAWKAQALRWSKGARMLYDRLPAYTVGCDWARPLREYHCRVCFETPLCQPHDQLDVSPLETFHCREYMEPLRWSTRYGKTGVMRSLDDEVHAICESLDDRWRAIIKSLGRDPRDDRKPRKDGKRQKPKPVADWQVTAEKADAYFAEPWSRWAFMRGAPPECMGTGQYAYTVPTLDATGHRWTRHVERQHDAFWYPLREVKQPAGANPKAYYWLRWQIDPYTSPPQDDTTAARAKGTYRWRGVPYRRRDRYLDLGNWNDVCSGAPSWYLEPLAVTAPHHTFARSTGFARGRLCCPRAWNLVENEAGKAAVALWAGAGRIYREDRVKWYAAQEGIREGWAPPEDQKGEAIEGVPLVPYSLAGWRAYDLAVKRDEIWSRSSRRRMARRLRVRTRTVP